MFVRVRAPGRSGFAIPSPPHASADTPHFTSGFCEETVGGQYTAGIDCHYAWAGQTGDVTIAFSASYAGIDSVDVWPRAADVYFICGPYAT